MLRDRCFGKKKIIYPNGVYIQDVKGICYTRQEWERMSSASRPVRNGIAVIRDNHSFVIATENWSDPAVIYGEDKRIDGVGEWGDVNLPSDINHPSLDFNGRQNTELIMGSTSGSNAAKVCYDYIFPNGKRGYLPAIGEWKVYAMYELEVHLCGAGWRRGQFWSSTQHGYKNGYFRAWTCGPTTYIVSDDSVYFTSREVRYAENVRPFTEL